MRKRFFTQLSALGLFLFFLNAQAQQITLSKIVRSHDGSEKFLYSLPGKVPDAEYLGEIEVNGFSADDAAVFSEVYKKAKQIGADSYIIKTGEDISGGERAFDPMHYFLELYYVPQDRLPKENNVVYLLSGSSSGSEVLINSKKTTIPERSYLRIPVDQDLKVSTGKFLSTSVKFAPSADQSAQFFQAGKLKFRQNTYGTAGINLKSDLIKLEDSYGMFLVSIYSKVSQ